MPIVFVPLLSNKTKVIFSSNPPFQSSYRKWSNLARVLSFHRPGWPVVVCRICLQDDAAKFWKNFLKGDDGCISATNASWESGNSVGVLAFSEFLQRCWHLYIRCKQRACSKHKNLWKKSRRTWQLMKVALSTSSKVTPLPRHVKLPTREVLQATLSKAMLLH